MMSLTIFSGKIKVLSHLQGKPSKKNGLKFGVEINWSL